MSRDIWDPTQYRAYGDERGRAFFELVGRVPADEPSYVVDLGCGPGELTATLARRWPRAVVDGFDSSEQMIAEAQAVAATSPTVPAPGTEGTGAASPTGGAVRFAVADIASWMPAQPVDVIISNAALHWVPNHGELLPRWVEALTPGGWLAFQVPGNFTAPSHAILRELCDEPPWRDLLAEVNRGVPVAEPGEYLDQLTRLGCTVDAWETTYLHVLQGDDPVLNWVKGTALRPVLAALDESAAAKFLGEYGARLRAAYPRQPYGTRFPFRRIFVVAQRP